MYAKMQRIEALAWTRIGMTTAPASRQRAGDLERVGVAVVGTVARVMGEAVAGLSRETTESHPLFLRGREVGGTERVIGTRGRG